MIIILTPSRDGMVHHSHIAAIEALVRAYAGRDSVLYLHLDGCSLVPHARNILTHRALDLARRMVLGESSGDLNSDQYPTLLWLDSDTVLDPADLCELFEGYEQLPHESVGLYSAATPPRPVPGAPRERTPDVIDTGGGAPVEVAAVGLACTIMSAGLFRQTWCSAEEYLVRGETYREVFAAGVQRDGGYMGEDVRLSAQARRMNLTNYVGTNVRVGHLGHTIARY